MSIISIQYGPVAYTLILLVSLVINSLLLHTTQSKAVLGLFETQYYK